MVGALALAGGACGGDDDDVADGASATSDDAAATSDASDDEGDSGDDGGSGGGEWCDAARNVEAETDLLDDVDFTDPESFEDAYQQVIDTLEDAADSAPDEIQDDVQLTLDAFTELFEALQEVEFDFLELDQAILENPEAEAASERIEAYNERECGSPAESDETDDTDGTADSDTGDDDTLSGEGTIRDEMVRQFTAMGMTDDQANCLVDNIDLEEVAASGAAIRRCSSICSRPATSIRPNSSRAADTRTAKCSAACREHHQTCHSAATTSPMTRYSARRDALCVGA